NEVIDLWPWRLEVNLENKITPKVSSFTWTALKGAILTQDNPCRNFHWARPQSIKEADESWELLESQQSHQEHLANDPKLYFWCVWTESNRRSHWLSEPGLTAYFCFWLAPDL
ncbi:hypothetical protein MTR67_049161, partial [Solanum verrucosum]